MMHPDYDDRTLSNDICLLELDEPFYMDEYVSFYLNTLLTMLDPSMVNDSYLF